MLIQLLWTFRTRHFEGARREYRRKKSLRSAASAMVLVLLLLHLLNPVQNFLARVLVYAY